MRSFIQKITDQGILSQIDKVVKFHGYLSTGAFIGIQMFNLAEKVLGESNDDRLFVTCETYNCLPDAFQALAGATIGNKGLNINDHGKMAVTISKRAPVGETIKGVRVVLDPAKTCQYPRLHAWYMKTDKVPHYEVVPILLEAGESVYTYEVLELKVPEKPKKNIVICERCGESFIQNGEEIICKACSVDND
jgi:formylmethanofuran dehydrogenase subunit E